MQENGRLGNLGLLQILVSTSKHNVGNAVAENLVSLFKQFLCSLVVVIQVLTHTNKLCPLSGENKCFHFFLFIFKYKYTFS